MKQGIHIDSRSCHVHSSLLSLHGNDRVAVIVLGVFVLFVVSVPRYDITAILAYASFPLLLILAARLSIGNMAKRLALLSPFMLIIAAANPILDQRTVITVGRIPLSAGLLSGLVILGKSLVITAAVLSFSACVPFYRLCNVLRSFGVPDIFVIQLMMLYRYSFLLLEEGAAIQRARDMRSFGKKGRDLFTTAKLIGTLLVRTTNRAERIYRSMVARGFSGSLGESERGIVSKWQWCTIVLLVTLFAVIRIIL